MKKTVTVMILFLLAGFGFAQETRQPTIPAIPNAPAAPAQPVVPGASGNTGYPVFPSFPSFPGNSNQANEPVREIGRYNLNVSGAFPNGAAGNNAANTINNAQYTAYSNRTAMLKLFFKNNSEYIYHLRNPRSRIEISAGVFRETYDVIVQAGREFLMEQYTGELSYNDNAIISFCLIGNNRVIVLLNFSR
jgi:hypothetical protein